MGLISRVSSRTYRRKKMVFFVWVSDLINKASGGRFDPIDFSIYGNATKNNYPDWAKVDRDSYHGATDADFVKFGDSVKDAVKHGLAHPLDGLADGYLTYVGLGMLAAGTLISPYNIIRAVVRPVKGATISSAASKLPKRF